MIKAKAFMFLQVEQLAVALERLTGATEGANICDNCVIYDVLMPCMEPMLIVQRAFRHHELITHILFELAGAMAREHSGELRREGGLLGADVRRCLCPFYHFCIDIFSCSFAPP
jgi:hypothetical protein